MNLKITAKELRNALSACQRAVSTRGTLPILSHVLLSVTGSTLRVAATNLEIAISVWLPCQANDEGDIAPPARLLTEYVSSTDGGVLMRLKDATGCKLAIGAGRSKADIVSLPAEDFPLITEFDDSQPSATIPADVLSHLVASTAYAASQDDSKPNLCNVEVSLNGGSLKLAATDGFRLAIGTRYTDAGFAEADDSDEARTVLIPATSLAEVERLVNLTDCESIQMQVTPEVHQVIFRFAGEYAGAELVTQLSATNFPAYSSIIPKEVTTTVAVDSTELTKAIKTAALFARDNNQIVTLTAEPGRSSLHIEASSPEEGSHHNDVDAEIAGSGVAISLNSVYLHQSLATFTGLVTLEFTQATRPVRITGDSGAVMAVISPMHPPR